MSSILFVLCTCVYMKIDYLTFDLGRTKCCPVHHVSYTAVKVEVATANGLGGDAFT